jgi:hypothetical protein
MTAQLDLAAEPGPNLAPAAPDHIRQLNAEWLRMWNGELAIAARIIAPKFTVHLPKFGMPAPDQVHDPATMAKWIGMFRGSFSVATFACELGPFSAGDFIISRFRFTGTWEGGRPPAATAASGTATEFRGVDILRLADGLIAEYWLTDDQLDLYAQLGAVPLA